MEQKRKWTSTCIFKLFRPFDHGMMPWKFNDDDISLTLNSMYNRLKWSLTVQDIVLTDRQTDTENNVNNTIAARMVKKTLWVYQINSCSSLPSQSEEPNQPIVGRICEKVRSKRAKKDCRSDGWRQWRQLKIAGWHTNKELEKEEDCVADEISRDLYLTPIQTATHNKKV